MLFGLVALCVSLYARGQQQETQPVQEPLAEFSQIAERIHGSYAHGLGTRKMQDLEAMQTSQGLRPDQQMDIHFMLTRHIYII